MRLLHTKSFTLHRIADGDAPDYAILSHTWTNDEIIFQDFVDGHIKDQTVRCKRASRKIFGACAEAANDGYEWIWIDSLCIDKSSSSELQEAINSMWSWYKNACICYVYLRDIPNERVGWSTTAFQRSRWFTRGWTLQELIAPCYVTFYSADWKSIGTKLRRIDEIHEVTGIAKAALESGNLTNHHAAEIMSWAAHREVSYAEDTAYSLMGLFDINMPMLYGEGGTKAFLRLQEAIYKYWADDTLFLYTYAPREGLPAMLAEHPRQFCRINGFCGRCLSVRGQICFPKSILYREIRPTKRSSPRLNGHGFGHELSLRRQGVRVNMVLIERDKRGENGPLWNLMTIPCDLGETKQDRKAPKASAVAVLDVMDPRGRSYCLELGDAQVPNIFQRLPTLGLLPLTPGLPGRMPIEIHTTKSGGRITHCLSLQFKSDFFRMRFWQPSDTLEVFEPLDEDQIMMNSDMADLDCSLVAYDPSVNSRQIAVGLAHRGPDNGSLRIRSVTVEDGQTIEHQTPETFCTDQYQLNLADGSTVLISIRQLPSLLQDEDGCIHDPSTIMDIRST